MLATLPTWYGMETVQAVNPAKVDDVRAALAVREDAMKTASIASGATIVLGAIALVIVGVSVFITPNVKRGGEDSEVAFSAFASLAALLLPVMLGAVLIAGALGWAVFFVLQGIANSRLLKAAHGHTRDSTELAYLHHGAAATDEGDWEAAGLLDEAEKLQDKADGIRYGYTDLADHRASEVTGLEREAKAKAKRRRATSLLDPAPRLATR